MTKEGLIPGLEEASKKETVELEIIREGMCNIAREGAEGILNFSGKIIDTEVKYGHEQSSIDDFARSTMITLLDRWFPHMEGTRRFENMPYNFRILREANDNDLVEKNKKYVLILDEIDGTTNCKRELANRRDNEIPTPHSATCIAVCKNPSVDSAVVGVIHTFDTRDTYSAFRTGNAFFSFKNDKIVRTRDYQDIKGDTATRIIVAGYSNKNRIEKGKWEDALYNTPHNKGGLRVYEGCRASSMDIINIIRGQYDAYVDPRALWGKQSGAMLQTYDIAAAIPIARGYGFEVSDVYGNQLTAYKLNDSIPIVISRSKELHKKILDTISPLLLQK
jgi:fructose-1,6-bisphosphatase/inositol monophosphatase family enzyme